MATPAVLRPLLRWFALLLLALVGLQVYFVAHIALMRHMDPRSTSFERSEAWRLWRNQGQLRWRQEWMPAAALSKHLSRAVIASEDDLFATHTGVQWDAIERAWQHNARAQARAQGHTHAKPPRIVGGSTITQQLAKNLFLSGERTLLRKGQELILTLALETFLSKQRILEIYLNHVEWGQGVFGAEAAAQHYFRKPAAQLQPWEAARLAVMLPRPRYFEKLPQSTYLSERANTVLARMGNAVLP